ncbi:MAG: S8 family serine peptidase [Breznakibacter sp.]
MNRPDKEIQTSQKPLYTLCTRLFLALLLLGTWPSNAQTNGYFVEFTDKNGTPHSLRNPGTFLSERAIVRRLRQQIAIDSTDLPVLKIYADSLKNMGLNVRHLSRWMNGAIVKTNDVSMMDTLARLGFVKSVQLTYGPFSPDAVDKSEKTNENVLKSNTEIDYGAAWPNIATVNGHVLHQKGYKGDGLHIAVIDAGFYRADELALLAHLFQNNQILGTRDFVEPGTNVYTSDTHGMYVLSIMAGYAPGTYIGTAPDASFWLLRTEDVGSEYPIEADNWVCAAEFADSVGVDIINSSLGYGYYDNPSLNLNYQALDGSSRISRAANMAVKKGMVAINSAGNEGNRSWRYVLTPADAQNVVAVGAMDADSARVSFSSVGPTADNRIKPDIMALGYLNAIQSTDGSIRYGSGTSFAAPIVTGLTACLWQSATWLTSEQIIEILRRSGHTSSSPNNLTGYGIPNFALALEKAYANQATQRFVVSGNPFRGSILIERTAPIESTVPWSVQLFDLHGRLMAKQHTSAPYIHLANLNRLANGFYVLHVEDGSHTSTFKLIKR